MIVKKWRHQHRRARVTRQTRQLKEYMPNGRLINYCMCACQEDECCRLIETAFRVVKDKIKSAMYDSSMGLTGGDSRGLAGGCGAEGCISKAAAAVLCHAQLLGASAQSRVLQPELLSHHG